MPNEVKQINGRWRVVERDTGKPVLNDAGTPVDGAGHDTKEAAEAQAAAINIHQHAGAKKALDPFVAAWRPAVDLAVGKRSLSKAGASPGPDQQIEPKPDEATAQPASYGGDPQPNDVGGANRIRTKFLLKKVR